MMIEEYLNENEWKNITPYLHCCMANVRDGLDWNIIISLYAGTNKDNEEEKYLEAEVIANATAEGIDLNHKHKFHLRIIPTKIQNPTYHLSKNAFMIFAKKRER